jgi:hypothetical protein
MRVRPATPDDLDRLRDVFRRSALPWDDDRDWLLAVDGRVVGFSTYERAGDALEAVDLFVAPRLRR